METTGRIEPISGTEASFHTVLDYNEICVSVKISVGLLPSGTDSTFPGLFTDTSEHIRFFLSTLPVLHC